LALLAISGTCKSDRERVRVPTIAVFFFDDDRIA
jgi:hypothetical protein